MPNLRFTGRKHSTETKKKQSEAHKGKKHSAEHRRRNSEARIGRKLSEETKKKLSLAHTGSKNSNWKGGRARGCGGYILVRYPSHPHVDVRGYIMEHRLVMEQYIGRVLLLTEVVHHINGIPDDNRIENLMLFSNNRQHRKVHKKPRKE